MIKKIDVYCVFLFFIIFIIIIILIYKKLHYLKPGTILFSVSNDDSEFSKAVSVSAIKKIDELPINHTAIVLENNMVIEATQESGVSLIKLKDFLKKSKIVFTANIKDVNVEKNAIKNSKQFLGKEYNYTFEPNNDSIYCSQLITESFLYDNGERYFLLDSMNFLDENNNFIPYWVEYYKKYKKEIPQGAAGSHPKRLFLQKNLFKKIKKIK